MHMSIANSGRRLIMLVVAAALAVCATDAGAQNRVRKNIDNLTASELRNFIHAFRKLVQISEANPDSLDGFAFFEAQHDDLEVGPCEHGRNTFFPWHRAHLHIFEEALRRSDPPRTSNVTLPYWDWSEPPSGKRYPAIFELQILSGSAFAGTDLEGIANPLHHDGRTSNPPICKPGVISGCARLPFPRAWVEEEVLNIKSWSGVGKAGFAGKASGQSTCAQHLEFGFGHPEGTAHNTIHDSYVAGDMSDPARAARDPLFWSFHAYFDLLFSQWQGKPGQQVDSCLDCKLCGLFRDRAQTDPFKVEHVLKTDTNLSYVYEYIPPPVTPMIAMSGVAAPTGARPLFAVHPGVDFALSGQRPPDIVRSYDVEIPRGAFEQARFVLGGVKANSRFTYQANVYLHPKNEPFRPMETAFRHRYLVELFTMWRAHHGGHTPATGAAGSTDWTVDITPQLKALAQQHAGEAWTVTIALVRRPLQGGAFTARARAASPPATVMGFDSFNLSIR